jgi:hypothetical protein
VIQATAIAPDTATTDALSTILNILDPAEGVAWIDSMPGTACLVVDAQGKQYTSREFSKYEILGRCHRCRGADGFCMVGTGLARGVDLQEGSIDSAQAGGLRQAEWVRISQRARSDSRDGHNL